MVVLCKLADPRSYRPFDWSLTADPEDFAYWTNLFLTFPNNVERSLLQNEQPIDGFEERWSEFYEEYRARFEEVRDHPERFDEITTFTLCRIRQEMLAKHRFQDPFDGVKRRENALAVALYPERVSEIDALPPGERWMELVRGMLAGNLFDLGAPATIEMYHAGQIDFHVFLDRLAPRPWLIDHADALLRRLQQGYGNVMIFVDNSGADIVLGVIPMARELARQGATVTLSANTRPALNDITHDELIPLLETLCASDIELSRLLAEGRLRAVASGNDVPLIDLGRVSEACNDAAADADLIVLQGMGRGVESNWRQAFTCDTWRVALLKDECVVKWVGGRLFDPVCRFVTPGGGVA